MIEDKLEHDERLRLECLAQSVAVHNMNRVVPADEIIIRAARYEKFVKTGETS